MTKAVYMLVGSKHRGADIENLVKSLPRGEPVSLRREHGNRYDPLAVQVWARGIHVGYIPARVNATLARRLDGMGEGAEIPGVYNPSSARWIEIDE